MPFRFPLEAVLRVRRSFERLEHLRLLALAAMIARVRRELESRDKQSSLAKHEFQQELMAGSTGAELHFELARGKMRLQQRLTLENRLLELARHHKKQQLAFLAARRKREILENLRTRRLDVYQREQARREQQQIDELFLIRSANPVE
jgi:flagellar export protein FliJ